MKINFSKKENKSNNKANDYCIKNLKLNCPEKDGIIYFVYKKQYIYFKFSYFIKCFKKFSFPVSLLNLDNKKNISSSNTKINFYFEISKEGIRNERIVISTISDKHTNNYFKKEGLNNLETIYIFEMKDFDKQVNSSIDIPKETKDLLYKIKEKINYSNDLKFVKRYLEASYLNEMLRTINYKDNKRIKRKLKSNNKFNLPVKLVSNLE